MISRIRRAARGHSPCLKPRRQTTLAGNTSHLPYSRTTPDPRESDEPSTPLTELKIMQALSQLLASRLFWLLVAMFGGTVDRHRHPGPALLVRVTGLRRGLLAHPAAQGRSVLRGRPGDVRVRALEPHHAGSPYRWSRHTLRCGRCALDAGGHPDPPCSSSFTQPVVVSGSVPDTGSRDRPCGGARLGHGPALRLGSAVRPGRARLRPRPRLLPLLSSPP